MTLTIERKTAGQDGAPHHNPSAIEIALLNNMPDGAIRSTQQQFARLLGAASGELDVRLHLFEMPDMPRSDRARAELLGAYRPVDVMLDRRFDGLIVTGCEPRAPTLPDEPFWRQLAATVDWADECTLSSIWSCLAAHAAVLRLDGVERRAFDAKLSGAFECTKRLDHELVRDMPLLWTAPHSRQYGLDAHDLLTNGYVPLTESSTAGVDIFVKRRRGLYVFFQGHLEYEADSLLREYLRDITRYLGGERERYPDIPVGLFSQDVSTAFDALRAQALLSRSPDLMTKAPVLRAQAELVNSWWAPAVSVYRRWLMMINAAKAAAAQSTAHVHNSTTTSGLTYALG